jgi:hypothetical protein
MWTCSRSLNDETRKDKESKKNARLGDTQISGKLRLDSYGSGDREMRRFSKNCIITSGYINENNFVSS